MLGHNGVIPFPLNPCPWWSESSQRELGRSHVQNRAYHQEERLGNLAWGQEKTGAGGGAMCKSEALCESTAGTVHQETLAAISSYL